MLLDYILIKFYGGENMSNGLAIDTELVNTSGSGINTNGTTFQEEVEKFKNHKEAILGIWNGEDATEFGNVANEVATLLNEASITVQEVGTHLVSTANAMDETVAANKSSMSGI